MLVDDAALGIERCLDDGLVRGDDKCALAPWGRRWARTTRLRRSMPQLAWGCRYGLVRSNWGENVADTYDVFLSYAHADKIRVQSLRDSLVACGLIVWFDDTDIDVFDGITAAVERGLRRSKAFIAFYSSSYPTRRACQWELTRAFLAAQRQGDPRHRILVINPEDEARHIEPVELRDGLFLRAPDLGDSNAAAAVAARVAEHIEMISDPLGGPGAHLAPQWYGRRPIAAARFVGRTVDMWKVHSALQANEVGLITGTHGASLAQVVGLGGIGKSLVAAEYALRYASAYPGGVFWLRAHGHDDIETAEARVAERNAQFHTFAQALGVSIDGLSPLQVYSALVESLDTIGQPYLWIADDLPSDLARDNLDDWLAPSPLGKTLITTRSRTHVALGSQVELGVLSEQDGIDLLSAHRSMLNDDDTEAAGGLVRDLGGHALAIDVAGAALAAERGVRSFIEYRAALADASADELELASRLIGELPTGHERSITSTLLRSIRALSTGGVDFLRIASVLAVEPIPAQLVVDILRIVDKLDPGTASRRAVLAMNEAHAFSLAEVVGRNGEDRAVHPLVARAMRLAAFPPDREASLRRAATAALTDALSPILHREQVSQTLVLHARHIADGLANDGEVVLLNSVAQCDRERGDFRSARVLQERVLIAAKRVYGDQDVNTCMVMSSLAGTLAELGDRAAALALFEHALELTRQSVGADDSRTLSLMNNVAEVRWALGDFEGALTLHEQTLQGRRKLLGNEHPQTLTSINNLAGTLADLGDLTGARTRLEDVLDARRRILGDRHPDTLSSMNTLGIILGALRDYQDARTVHEQTLNSRRQVLGARHPYTLTSMNNLAVTLGELGYRRAAQSLHAETLQMRQAVLGNRHPDTLTSMNNLASTTGELGDLEGARLLHAQTLQLRFDVLGAEHPETLMSMSNVAAVLWRQGDLGGAQELQECVIDTRRGVLGEEHPDTLKAVSTMAKMMRDLDKPSVDSWLDSNGP